MPRDKKKKDKHKINLSSKLLRTIAILLVIFMAIIIVSFAKGIDLIYLGYSAISSAYGETKIVSAYSKGDSDNFLLEMDNIEREHEFVVELYTRDGRLVYSSSYKGEMSVPPYDGDSIALPDSEKKNYDVVMDLGKSKENSFFLGRDTSSTNNYRYLVGTWGEKDGMTVRIFKATATIDAASKIAFIFITVIMAILVSVMFIIMSVFVRRTVKPLTEMSIITKNMSNLDFSKKCKPNNVYEISQLSESINEMSSSLEQTLVNLKEQNKKLEDDIEKEKTIDQLRQVFISGISHELKTPIAIIQGYAEGLKLFLDSDPETAKKYCDTVISETERMNELVMRLLDITKYESGEYKLLYEDFNISGVIDDWIERNSERLHANGITAVNEVDKSIVGFGDLFILSTVVNNYMTNAAAHVKEPNKIIVSSAENGTNGYRISIFNTGEPIAEKDIDKIWNSFYRVDKAMSRAQGHFGLGLAIVAAIQKLHEQGYGVKNHDDGVEFWFDVKKFDGE